MKQLTNGRTRRTVVILLAVVLVVLAVFAAVRINHSRNCRDIIGDGYVMGTDPEPVVIGNTCDPK